MGPFLLKHGQKNRVNALVIWLTTLLRCAWSGQRYWPAAAAGAAGEGPTHSPSELTSHHEKTWLYSFPGASGGDFSLLDSLPGSGMPQRTDAALCYLTQKAAGAPAAELDISDTAPGSQS